MRSVLPFKKCAIVQSSSPYTPFVIYVQAKKTSSKTYAYLINVTAPLLHNNCSSQDGHLFQVFVLYTVDHGLINYKDIKAKCRHLKILTCKETLWQVFKRVYKLDIQSVMLVFSIQLCELFPFSLVQLSPPSPLPCVNNILYSRLQFMGSMEFWALDR
jgi:hypothetical protein